MALYVLQPGIQPAGQFDFLDADLASCEGGMLGTLDEAARTNSASVKAAADVLDGYVADGSSAATRVVMRLADSGSETNKLFYLLDDGTTGYGTLFGSVIGGPAGLGTTGSALGPHTGFASGKVTAWDKAGLYAVSTSAVAADLADLTDTPLPGALLYRYTSGKITSLADTGDKVAQFVEMSSSRSLVNTPAKLVGAAEVFDRVVIQYLGASHGA